MILLSAENDQQFNKVQIVGKTGYGTVALAMRYFRHLLLAGHRGGYGVHSPFVFDFLQKAVFNRKALPVPQEVLIHRSVMERKQEPVELTDPGAGSRTRTGHTRTVASLAGKASVTRKQGALLYRMARWYEPRQIIELGSGLGISTAYLAAGSGGVQVTSVEGDPGKYAVALANRIPGQEQVVSFLRGTFDDHFPSLLKQAPERTLWFIDGDHRYAPTVERVQAILGQERTGEAMIVLDDIHWSDGMEKAWIQCCNDPRSAVTLDLFHVGIIFRRKDIARYHFRVLF